MLLRLSMALVSLVAMDADPVDPTPAFIANCRPQSATGTLPITSICR
jgi:hypothetical protein